MTVNKKLFEQCKKRDGRAQRELYDLFKARLMGLCRRYTKDRDDAQDLLQDTFIKIFSRIDQVSSEEKLEGWMLSVAVNTAIDFYRQKKRNEVFVSSTTDHDVADTAYELILDNLTDEYLIQLVNELPDGCRVVFNLSIVEGYSHQEISKLLDVTESTSRSQLHYAKQLLKEKLSKVGIKHYEKYA
ncbi:RNA polymerase sigma factor [Pseudochryseolinea flava]|nr:RNA polymerase sigma factor [Pseudochryseolinea flava]